MRSCVCRLALVTVAVSFVAQQATAELPPGSYVKLRKSAPIVLAVRITKTAPEKDDVAALHRVACTATIEAVDQCITGLTTRRLCNTLVRGRVALATLDAVQFA